LFGLIAESVEDIDRERAALDFPSHHANKGRTRDDVADDAIQLDFSALFEAVKSEPAAPVVSYRRRRRVA